MAGTIKLTKKEWRKISNQLTEDFPKSYMLIRTVQRRELGFTVRDHRIYSEQTGTEHVICLDFFDDSKETWFRLKYL